MNKRAGTDAGGQLRARNPDNYNWWTPRTNSSLGGSLEEKEEKSDPKEGGAQWNRGRGGAG